MHLCNQLVCDFSERGFSDRYRATYVTEVILITGPQGMFVWLYGSLLPQRDTETNVERKLQVKKWTPLKHEWGISPDHPPCLEQGRGAFCSDWIADMMPRSYKEEEVLLPGSERHLWLPVRAGVVGKLLLGTSTGSMPIERESSFIFQRTLVNFLT